MYIYITIILKSIYIYITFIFWEQWWQKQLPALHFYRNRKSASALFFMLLTFKIINFFELESKTHIA